MGVNIPQALIALLNKTDPGYIPYAFMVPTRIFRVIADVSFRTFRVEQFIRHNRNNLDPKGAWRTLSTHGSETAGVMLMTAMKAAAAAQLQYQEKMVKKRGGIIRP